MSDKAQETWIGVDLGGTKVYAAVYDADYRMLGEERTKTKGFEGQQAGVRRIIKSIELAMVAAGRSAQDLDGIGVACPGPINLNKGVLLSAPNLGWKNVELKLELETAFKCPVALLNDVDAGVYGEYVFGAGRNAHCLVGVFPGTGVGGGCVYEGKVLRGKKHTAFEIGHIPLQPDGPLCGCGQRGCLEALCSRLSIAVAATAAAYRGDAPHLLEKTDLKLSKVRSGTLRDAIKAGDKAVERIVEQAAEWMGVGIATVVNLLSPDVVVLGGGLVEAMPELIASTAERVARKRVLPTFRDSFEVTLAKLGDEAGVRGAAAWARQEVTQHGAT